MFSRGLRIHPEFLAPAKLKLVKSISGLADMPMGLIAVAGAPVMRRVVVIACVLALLTTGCATHRVEFVPAGVDRDELAAAIARQGQDSTPDEHAPTSQPAPRQTRFDRTVQVGIEVAPWIPVVLVSIPLVGLYALAPGPKSGVDWGKAWWLN
jgi:hypothetical protein